MTRLFKAPALKSLLLVGAAAAVLAACNRKEDEAAAPPAIPPGPSATTAAAADLSYESKNAYANVKLTLPEAVKGQPELHRAVYDASVKDLQTFVEGAQADRTEAGGDGGMPPYERVIEYKSAVQTGKLFGLGGTSYEFTGGAHGNPAYLSILWDKALKRRIDLNALLKPGVDRGALERLLCAAVNTEKKVRDPQAATLTLGPPRDGAFWSCPALSETVVGLAPSTIPGKAGGLTFLIGPYVVGPYAEGGYEIDLPQSAIRTLLNPAYADEFAGAPPRREG
jgi:hypothetical protein